MHTIGKATAAYVHKGATNLRTARRADRVHLRLRVVQETHRRIPTNCWAFSDTRNVTSPKLADGVKHASWPSLKYEAGTKAELPLISHTYSEPKLKARPLMTTLVWPRSGPLLGTG